MCVRIECAEQEDLEEETAEGKVEETPLEELLETIKDEKLQALMQTIDSTQVSMACFNTNLMCMCGLVEWQVTQSLRS